MARPRIPDEISPRADMLRAATRLLRQGGLAAAGINQIIAESGAPKGSLYHFFPDGKTQIAREALAAYREMVVERYRARAASCRTPEEAVRAFFEMGAEAALKADYRMSCPAGTVTLDLDPESEALRAPCNDVFASLVDAVDEALHPIPKSKRRDLAGVIVSTMQGAYIRARAARDVSPFREAGENLAALAKMLTPSLRNSAPRKGK
jgi:TetR/AcrR family transcriptional regulator, lmrAB and yxaGH operons repressor